jgi:hypothetical protein
MRAEELRTIAGDMRHKDARGMTLRLADDCEKVAAMLEKGALSREVGETIETGATSIKLAAGRSDSG